MSVAILALGFACSSAELVKPPPTVAVEEQEDAQAAIDLDSGVPPRPDALVTLDGQTLTYVSELTVQIMPSDRGASILDAIRTAKTSVHMTMYLLTNAEVISALRSAKAAGREVRVVLNKDFPVGGNANQSAFNQLQSAGVEVVWGPPAYTFTHAKTMVIDGSSGWIMTMNLTATSPTTNREYLVRITGKDEVAELEQIFVGDFTNKSVDIPGRLVVSPASATPLDPQRRLKALIEGATRTVDIEGESLSDTVIVDALIAAKKAGIAVRAILNDGDPSSAQAAAVVALKAAQIPIVRVATPDIHAKAIVVDGVRAYIGSQNFTMTSLLRNREVGVLTDNLIEVKKVASTIDGDFTKGVPY